MHPPDAPDDDHTHKPDPVLAEEPTLLVMLEGKHVSRRIPRHGEVTIGRAASNHVVIDHRSVSRAHAVLRLGDCCTLEDLGSSNGTRVNGAPLTAHTLTTVPDGAFLEVGSAALVLRGLDAPKAEPRRASSGPSQASAGIDRWVELVAGSDITVLLLGETGVGKGIVAERIHRRSARAARPCVSINCGALAETLLESELFGHERGAFTGATTSQAGLLETAQDGTVFLDEVGELSPQMQVKLLRVLENREVIRVGGRKPIAIQARFIAATNRDLDAMVAQGRFRQDLLFRLNAICIRVPPLRERVPEIGAFAEQMLRERGVRGRLTPSALTALERHAWPGNLRELRNVLERAALLSGGGDIRPEHLGLPNQAPRALPEEPPSGLRGAIDALEKERIARALDQAGGNQTRAAELLGISRRTLLRRLDAHQVRRPRKGDPRG